jgi:hypothetical protein
VQVLLYNSVVLAIPLFILSGPLLRRRPFDLGDSLLLPLFGLVAFAPQLLTLLGVWSTLRNNPWLLGTRTYAWNMEGFALSEGGEPGREIVAWEVIIKVIETRTVFLFYLSEKDACFFPRRAVHRSEELAELRRIIRAGIGDRAELRDAEG